MVAIVHTQYAPPERPIKQREVAFLPLAMLYAHRTRRLLLPTPRSFPMARAERRDNPRGCLVMEQSPKASLSA